MQIFTHKPLKYAVIMAAVTAVCLILMEATGSGFDTKSPYLGFATFLAPFVIWYYGLKAKKAELKGKMTFKQGVTEAFRISVYYAIISPFVFLVYYAISPNALPYVREAYGMTGTSDGMVIAVDMLAQVISAIIGGTLYGAILAIFMRSKK
jgi:hypothetical protein